jgi:hypothetical protein
MAETATRGQVGEIDLQWGPVLPNPYELQAIEGLEETLSIAPQGAKTLTHEARDSISRIVSSGAPKQLVHNVSPEGISRGVI